MDVLFIIKSGRSIILNYNSMSCHKVLLANYPDFIFANSISSKWFKHLKFKQSKIMTDISCCLIGFSLKSYKCSFLLPAFCYKIYYLLTSIPPLKIHFLAP